MRILRSPLTGKPPPVRSSLPIRRKASENNKKFEELTPTPSKFIVDSSPFSIEVGMHAHPCAARRANPS
jgi:hypothetical protein